MRTWYIFANAVYQVHHGAPLLDVVDPLLLYKLTTTSVHLVHQK